MSPLRVSEKTLEINVCAEILYIIRQLPGCTAAFWIGMKQDQEARLGIDELIHNIPAGLHLAMQFKAPKANPPDTLPFHFTINDKQNGHLLRLANIRPQSVYYVLPQYNTFRKMRAHSPHLLTDTWFLKVHDLNGLRPSTNRLGTHLVETTPPSATVYSDPLKVDLLKPGTTLQSIFNRETVPRLSDLLIDSESLKGWLSELIKEADGNKYVVGQQLRGLFTILVS